MSTRSAQAKSLAPWMAAAALALALAAQLLLDRPEERLKLIAVGVFIIASVLLLLATWSQSHSVHAAAKQAYRAPAAWRLNLVWLVLPAALIAWVNLADNRYSLVGGLAWLAGIAVLLISAYQAPLRSPSKQSARFKLGWTHLALLGAMVAGAGLRLCRLAEIPAEMGPDLPHNVANIRSILEGDWPIFFPSWPGREGLFFYLSAIPASLVGLSHLSIKLTSALIGIATIPLVYLLGKELYRRSVGVIAAWLYAASTWAVITSRVGLRMVLVPTLLALTWFWMVRGLNRRNRWHLALAGLALGLGLHSYNAFIAVPFLVLGWMLTEVIAGRSKRLWEMRVGFVYLFGIAALLFLPLGRYMMDEPGNYLLRVTTRVTATEVPLPPNPLWVLIQNMLNSLGMFNYHGDLVSVLNVVGVRQFGLVAAAMLPLGVVYLGARPRYANNLAVLITILVMLLPSALSIAFPREVPNTGRAIGALVPAIIASSVALDAIRRSLAPPSAVKPLKDAADQPEAQLAAAAAPRRRVIRRGQILAWGLVAVLLAAETAAAYPYYFERFRTNLPQSNYSISLEMARVMDAYADQGRVYIKTQGHWYDGNAVRAQLRRLSNWNDEFWELVPGTAPLDDLRGKVLVIVHPDDTAAIETLRRAFTSHSIEKHYNYDGEPTFIAFYGER